jgi:hypothetical protein
MIIQNRHTRNWEATCDRCSNGNTEVEADDFREAVRILKEEGWSVYKNEDDEWTHACIDCGLT